MQTQPGLYFLVPFLQNVRLYDTRIQTMEPHDPERFLTAENRNVLVDSFVKWRVIDVRQYYVSVNGDAFLAEARIAQTVNDAMRAEFARHTVHDVVSGERDKIMAVVSKRVDEDLHRIGVAIVDVRLKRVDFVPEISSDVYRRMESERKRVANELRATGQAESEKIKADADRQRQVIVAEAYRDAQRVKGEGDAQASPHLRRGVRARCGVLQLLPQPRGLPPEHAHQERRDDPRSVVGFLQVPEEPGTRKSPGEMTDVLVAAIALMLVIEGILPFSSPRIWRELFVRLTQMSDGQIRFAGLTSMMVGLIIIFLIR